MDGQLSVGWVGTPGTRGLSPHSLRPPPFLEGPVYLVMCLQRRLLCCLAAPPPVLPPPLPCGHAHFHTPAAITPPSVGPCGDGGLHTYPPTGWLQPSLRYSCTVLGCKFHLLSLQEVVTSRRQNIPLLFSRIVKNVLFSKYIFCHLKKFEVVKTGALCRLAVWFGLRTSKG